MQSSVKINWLKSGVIAAAFMLTAATSAWADWSFAVLCDSRSGYSTDPADYQSPDGISPYFKNVASVLAKEGGAIDFVLNPGDLARGKKPYNTDTQMTANLAQWNIFMQPVYNAGMPVYDVRGNHDAYGVNPVSGNPTADSTSIWKSGTTIPSVDPVTQDTGAQAGLSYSFTHKGALLVGLDEYVGSGLTVTSTSYDQSFLQSQLAQPGFAHKFVFAHQPLWNYKYDELGPAGLAADLENGHVDLYFSGHVHSYQRIKEAGYRFQEMIIGTAGAPQNDPTLAPGDPSYLYDPNLTVLNFSGGSTAPKFGYAVITVHDNGAITSVMKFLDDPTNPNSTVSTFDAADVTPSFVDISAQVSMTTTGIGYSRISKQYTSTVTVTNSSQSTITGPFAVALANLTAGVTLANASGTYAGLPYITSATQSLAPGQSLSIPLQFSNPSNIKISFTPVTYQM